MPMPETRGAGDHPRCNGHDIDLDDPVVVQADAYRVLVASVQPRDVAGDHGNAEGGEFRLLLRTGLQAVREVAQVIGPLAEQQRLVHGVGPVASTPMAVADLPAVAVRAVDHLPAPPFAQPRDVRQLVDQAGGDQQAARGQHAAVAHPHSEPVRPADTSLTSAAMISPP